jgi:hypothetical protein
MQTIIKLSITLKLNILLSVLLTVLKFRFSLVRKYFWFLVIVDSSPEILKIDSSNADVCSGDVPCLEGIEARCSFSTYCPGESAIVVQEARGKMVRSFYSDFEVDKLLRECAHLVIEAKSVFSSFTRGEDEVSLSLLFPIHDDLVRWSHNLVIDIEGASCLNLLEIIYQCHVQSSPERSQLTAK